MREKRQFIASLDQVRITREDDTAVIEYADPRVRTALLKLGSTIHTMSDQQILDRFNDRVAARQRISDAYEHVAIEIPVANRSSSTAATAASGSHEARCCDAWSTTRVPTASPSSRSTIESSRGRSSADS